MSVLYLVSVLFITRNQTVKQCGFQYDQFMLTFTGVERSENKDRMMRGFDNFGKGVCQIPGIQLSCDNGLDLSQLIIQRQILHTQILLICTASPI